ncbi:MAG: TonB family protein, partial [Gemmatimonadetes bacterium]|nr:TonB family protein [Gemmatimonadota bacterium]
PDVKAGLGMTALISGTIAGRVGVVSALLNNGADPDVRNAAGSTALMVASVSGRAGLVDTLLAHGADVNFANELGLTSLMLAALEGYVDVVRSLLARGADPNVRDPDGATALTAAKLNGDAEVIRLLEEAGAEPEQVLTSDAAPADSAAVTQEQIETVMDEPPQLLSSPPLRYPEMLKQAGLEGDVVLDFVIDTTGHVEPRSIQVVSSLHPLFEAAARDVILGSVYRPAQARGVPVRARVQQPLSFTIQ